MAFIKLSDEYSLLENNLIETMIAGLKRCHPDLDYPESHSDMQACARALMVMYDIKRSALAKKLYAKCEVCEGLGKLITEPGVSQTCSSCRGTCVKEFYW